MPLLGTKLLRWASMDSMSQEGIPYSQEGSHEAHAWMRSISAIKTDVDVVYEYPGDLTLLPPAYIAKSNASAHPGSSSCGVRS